LRRPPLEDVIVGVAFKLRDWGYSVSTAEIVKAVELAEAYEALTGQLTPGDLRAVLEASFPRAPGDAVEEALREELSRIDVRERAERLSQELRGLLAEAGLRPGGRASRKLVASSRRGRERRRALAAYVSLRRLGAVRGAPGRERVLDDEGLEELAFRLASHGFSSLKEAIEESPRGFSWDDLLDAAEHRLGISRKRLASMSERGLVRAAEAARRKGDEALHRAVAEEILARLEKGVRLGDAEAAARILEREGLLTPWARRALSYSAGDPLEGMGPEDVARVAESLGVEDGGLLVARAAKAMGEGDLERLASTVDPRLLWAVRLRRPAWLAAAADAARALREALKYVEALDEARADMAAYYLDRAKRGLEREGPGPIDAARLRSLIAAAEALLSAPADWGDPAALQGVLSRLDYPSAVTVLRGVYSHGGPGAKAAALSVMERLLYRVSSREGSRLLPRRERAPSPPGRFDSRRTIYNVVRRSPRPLVYVRRMRARPIVLVLDASGSMLEYAAWSIAVASMFPRHVRRLVVFREDVEVHDGPLSRRVLAEVLLSTRFQGYTNISAALRAANVPGVRNVVVISDLRQTVGDEPVAEAASRLVRAGKRLLFIAPRGHDYQARLDLEARGARVVEAPSPERAAREVLRSLLR